jgi:hypothetical protein
MDQCRINESYANLLSRKLVAKRCETTRLAIVKFCQLDSLTARACDCSLGMDPFALSCHF